MNHNIHLIIQQLRNTASKNEKEAIIKSHREDALFRQCLEMTYSPLIKFGVKALPEPTQACDPQHRLSLEEALSALTLLSSRQKTGNAAINHVAYLLGHLSDHDAEILRLVLGKSLKIGCDVTTINKAIGKNFIKETPYSGAVSYDRKKVMNLFKKYDQVFSQMKMDGRFTNIVVDGDLILMESRQGLPTYFGEAFDFLKGMDAYYGEAIVLNGELVIDGIDRYTANGIIASLVSIGDKIQEGQSVDSDLLKFEKEFGEPYASYLHRLKTVVWDFIPMSIYTGADKWHKPYSERFDLLRAMINNLNHPRLALVESRLVANAEAAMEHFLEMRARGEEGTILKGNAHWQDGKPTHNVKFKNEIELDLIVVSGNLGTAGTKNASVISSINVQSQDGLLKSSAGGMSESLMRWVTDNLESLTGTIVAVKCNGISQDREGNYSLLHPAVVRFRDDKSTANSLAECLDIDKASQELTR